MKDLKEQIIEKQDEMIKFAIPYVHNGGNTIPEWTKLFLELTSLKSQNSGHITQEERMYEWAFVEWVYNNVNFIDDIGLARAYSFWRSQIENKDHITLHDCKADDKAREGRTEDYCTCNYQQPHTYGGESVQHCVNCHKWIK